MRFFPDDKFSIQTSKSIEQIIWILQANTEAYRPSFFRKASGKLFWGYITGNMFEIQPIISYRNNFAPVIKGYINNQMIDIHMRLHTFVIIFMSFWLSMCAIFICISTFIMMKNQQIQFPMFIPHVMFVLGFVMTHLGYSFEAGRVKEKLRLLLQDNYYEGY